MTYLQAVFDGISTALLSDTACLPESVCVYMLVLLIQFRGCHYKEVD